MSLLRAIRHAFGKDAASMGKTQAYGHDTWKRFKKNKAAVVGLIIMIIYIIVALFADFIVPYDACIDQHAQDRLQGPSSEHLMGTDEFGRDIFARIVHGSRRSLSLGVVSTVISMLIGCALAAICGYYGGAFDAVIMRICDVFTCIPTFLFALSIVAALGASLTNLLLAITIVNVPYYVRMVRSIILSVVEEDYVEAARAADTRGFKMIIRHILPNCMGPIIVEASMSVADMLLTAAGLSFIGMGIQPPEPEWGAMLSNARQYMGAYPYILIFPGLAITIASLALNIMGDGLRDALDPRLKE